MSRDVVLAVPGDDRRPVRMPAHSRRGMSEVALLPAVLLAEALCVLRTGTRGLDALLGQPGSARR